MKTPRSPSGARFSVPDGHYFHPGHAWVRPEGGKIVRVGLDDFAARLLGTPERVELPRLGQRVQMGEHGWAVHVDGSRVPMLAPVDGKVVALNQGLRDAPEIVSADPFGAGWLLEVCVNRPRAAFTSLLMGELAAAWMAQTTERVRALCNGQLGMVLPDGGEPVAGFARVIAPDRWDAIARDFLLTD